MAANKVTPDFTKNPMGFDPYDIGKQIWSDYCVSVGVVDSPEHDVQFTEEDCAMLREMGIAESESC